MNSSQITVDSLVSRIIDENDKAMVKYGIEPKALFLGRREMHVLDESVKADPQISYDQSMKPHSDDRKYTVAGLPVFEVKALTCFQFSYEI